MNVIYHIKNMLKIKTNKIRSDYKYCWDFEHNYIFTRILYKLLYFFIVFMSSRFLFKKTIIIK